jgi:hypothetical protein
VPIKVGADPEADDMNPGARAPYNEKFQKKNDISMFQFF